jgi:hypothetical protein
MPALSRLRQEDHKFEASLGCTVRPVSKTTVTKKPIVRRQRSGGSQFKASPWQIILQTFSQKNTSKKGLA